MTTRRFALILGLFFAAAGIAGFVPQLAHPETGMNLAANTAAAAAAFGPDDPMLFGLFPVNPWHNLVHLSFGLWGLAASRSAGGALGYARAVAIVYALLALAGLRPGDPDRLRPGAALRQGRLAARRDRACRRLFRLGQPQPRLIPRTGSRPGILTGTK